MPPTNVSFVTATDLGAVLPISNTQNDINDAGVNFTVFYKFTCPAGLKQVYVLATSGNTSGYMPKSVPYDVAQIEILVESTIAPLANNPIQFPVTPGQIHYIQVVKNANSAGPEHVNLTISAAPDAAIIPNGAIIVPGDIEDQPCGIFSGTGNYETIKFIKNIAISEAGDIAISGRLLLANNIASDKYIALYSGNNLTELGRDSTMVAFTKSIRFNRTTLKFWMVVSENVGFSKIYKLDPTIVPLVKTLAATLTGFGSADSIATNNAETILYFSQNTALGQPIKRWNLLTDTVMADFVVGPGGTYAPIDVLVLEDDTVLVGWSDGNSATGIISVVHYSVAGAILNTYTFNSFEEPDYGRTRLAYALDSPTHFWVKVRERIAGVATGNAQFKKIRVVDGVEVTTISHMEYHERNYIGPSSASYPGETGPWNSCPFVIYPVGTTTPSGLYIIVTNKRNDDNLAIPAPTFKTALLP